MKKWMERSVPRRLLSLVLSVAMVLSLLPVPAFAEEQICTCETACTEGAVKTDCPVCGTEGGQCAATEPEP